MRKRRISRYRLDLERLEPKRLLSAGASTSPITHLGTDTTAVAPDAVVAPSDSAATSSNAAVSPSARKPLHGYLVYRVTNPKLQPLTVTPPFGQVLVQAAQPVPGQVYNVLQLVVRNNTKQTFTAASGLTVRLSSQRTSFPILTGNETWQPGQWFIFYVLTKKYYPINNQIAGGFVFNLGGAQSVAIPGPSGIFLRLTYNPATFPQTLNWIVTHGQGAQGGKGIAFGMPDTAIYEFVNALTQRTDFGGYF